MIFNLSRSLLPYSETFIPAQAEALRRYQGYYVGVGREPSGLGHLPSQRLCLLEDAVRWSKPSATAFRLGGVLPKEFLRRLQAHQPRLIHAHFGPMGYFPRRSPTA
ncbi:MAG: hypothetical protein HC857_00270 [Synechococcales cyanobacterium RU_4_20]|nr:hypothetical protein [Synechococcales cyanobacterium RU_4_20]